jgi:hypothetical protein
VIEPSGRKLGYLGLVLEGDVEPGLFLSLFGFLAAMR